MGVMRPDKEGTQQIDRAGSRCNGHQSGHSTGARTDRGGFLVAKPIDNQPGDGGNSRGYMGYQEGVGGQSVCGETTTGIESEPPQPQERRSHKNKRNIVGRDSSRALRR